MIRVFKDHRLVDEYPRGRSVRVDGEELVVRDGLGVELARHEPGAWHAAGDMACGGLEEQACDKCAPSQA